ncbi:hypothetical protein QG37_05016 [Candidozyma auris]|uniref:Uncharacterized protein n=1 Tax=Candidozyma auris TaxID=498019 RepID=A0A0L0NW43_CANAR|nr:hypothetical protein QG37_05016 [[Candida] auris]
MERRGQVWGRSFSTIETKKLQRRGDTEKFGIGGAVAPRSPRFPLFCWLMFAPGLSFKQLFCIFWGFFPYGRLDCWAPKRQISLQDSRREPHGVGCVRGKESQNDHHARMLKQNYLPRRFISTGFM